MTITLFMHQRHTIYPLWDLVVDDDLPTYGSQRIEYVFLILQRLYKAKQQVKVSDLSVELDNQYQILQSENFFDANNIKDERDKVVASILRRRGQKEFRDALLKAYGSQCLVTGCTAKAVLEAAHIIAYQGPTTNHVANGLLLRADIHTLFDLHLLSINPDGYEVDITLELTETCYGYLKGKKILLPTNNTFKPDKFALGNHYQDFLRNQKGLTD